MLILTGVNGNKARVYDSDDNTNEITDFYTLVTRLRKHESKLRIYGLRLYNPSELYPTDARSIPQLGVVIIPSEAHEAAAKIERSQ